MADCVRFVCLLALLGAVSCYVDKTVYQYLVDNGYSSFVQLLKETKQDGILEGPGPVTVFAPSNAAFSKLDPDIMASFAKDALQKTSMVKYHIVDGLMLVPQLAATHTVSTSAGQKMDVELKGQVLLINNVSHVVAAPNNDVICKNGVVQPIDSLLLPPLYSKDNLFAVLVERDDLFQEYVMAMLLTNLTTLVERGEYTLFAPTNSAFARYVGSWQHPNPNITAATWAMVAYEMNKYTIVPGARSLDMLQNGQVLYTLHGTPLHVRILNGVYYINQARVVQGDIAAANGVIHAVDDTLFPMDLLPAIGISLPPSTTRATAG